MKNKNWTLYYEKPSICTRFYVPNQKKKLMTAVLVEKPKYNKGQRFVFWSRLLVDCNIYTLDFGITGLQKMFLLIGE